jgi:Pentapeptide repeats (8 copies)
MADHKQVELLRRDVDDWNRWKVENPSAPVDLTGADLGRTDLLLANLSGADLSGANLVLANLKGADLSGANLRGANLVGARMIGVDLERADLCGADLRTAEDLTQEQLTESVGDKDTQLPEGLKHPAGWPHR